MNQRDQFVGTEDHPTPAALSPQDVLDVIDIRVIIIGERNEFVTGGIRKLSECTAERTGELPSPISVTASRRRAHHGGKERASDLLFGLAHHLWRVCEKALPFPVGHRPYDALRPGVPSR